MTEARTRLTAALADHYRIERELGAGGMATVFLAHDLKHDRTVAIKVLRPELAAAIGAERFLSEIKTTARLQHPHVLALHDSGAVDGLLYYVMPFIDGESLRDRLDREKQLPLDDALRIISEVADALDYAHRAGIVHRDIKPENILLSEGHAVVADFGIARAVSESETARLTQTGQVIGTPAYLSPEQVTNEPLDGRSDIYSLGCVLYECLTGELPFSGTMMAMLAQRMTSPPPSLQQKRGDLPAQLSQVIAKAMATQSADRYRTGHELASALSAPMSPATRHDGRAIVVLPFANHSPDPDNEYFSDGLTEEITNDLASVKSLRVISRTSAMRLKGTDKDVRTIGRELGVRYVLEGSVRKAGNSLRITAQLIDAETDIQLWAEKYRGTMDDVFELQERVAREIVRALGLTLTSDEDRRLSHRSIANVRAFELYLQARQELRRYGTSIDRGMALLNRAIEIEGETPPLQALVAWAKVSEVRSGLAADSSRVLAEAETVADALIQSAPDAPYGHALLGFICYERGRMANAVRHFRAALDREPNDADALFYTGICYIAAGHNDRAEAAAGRLMASDPLSPLPWLLSGLPGWFAGMPATGLPFLQRAVEMDPESLIGRWSLGYNYAFLANLPDATRQAEFMQDKAPDMPYTRQLLALIAALRGEQAAALMYLDGVAGLDGHHKFHLAEAFAMAGATDQALTLLEEAVNEGFHPYPFIAEHCPFIAPLRGLPRFDVVAERAKQMTDALYDGAA